MRWVNRRSNRDLKVSSHLLPCFVHYLASHRFSASAQPGANTVKTAAKKTLGYVVYEGPSSIDGAPIAVICTLDSANDKTGNMVQTWILRTDVNPVEALQTGADASICGECPHRPILARATGDAPCYVQVAKAPLGIWHAYHRGRYDRVSPRAAARLLSGRTIRIGSYGDPFAAPYSVWWEVTRFAAGWTGYTHQWRVAPVEWAYLVMASVDSTGERDIAHAMGWRTFRVSVGVDVRPGEISCPASDEGGNRVQCIDCKLCAGQQKRAKDIVIADHATGAATRVARRTIAIAVATI
jgi:hypothetical protein